MNAEIKKIVFVDFKNKFVYKNPTVRHCIACGLVLHPDSGLYRLDDGEIACPECIGCLVDMDLLKLG